MRVRIGGPLVLAAAALWTKPAAAQTLLPPFLELRIPKPPTVATGGGGSFLTYEMHVTNFAAALQTIKRVEVFSVGANGARTVLATLSDSMLTRSLTRPGTSTPPADRARLAGGSRAVVWLWVPVDRQAPPGSIVTRLVLEQGSGDSAKTQELDSPAAEVAREAYRIK